MVVFGYLYQSMTKLQNRWEIDACFSNGTSAHVIFFNAVSAEQQISIYPHIRNTPLAHKQSTSFSPAACSGSIMGTLPRNAARLLFICTVLICFFSANSFASVQSQVSGVIECSDCKLKKIKNEHAFAGASVCFFF